MALRTSAAPFHAERADHPGHGPPGTRKGSRVLKRVFVAPDPGRVRLRFASRAVIGVGLAVALCGLVGHSLVAAITGGLAALLALFTVTDATVRQQAVTTALLPAAGLPVLAVAAVLHDQPLARDLVFLAVMGAGVYARRWGPRGHALGIFAFMTFFAAQFLHTVPGQLPELYAAVLLSLAASAAVRFGLWCYERRLPAVAVPAPPEGRGWPVSPPGRRCRPPWAAPSRWAWGRSSPTSAGTGPSAPPGGCSSTPPRAARPSYAASAGCWAP